MGASRDRAHVAETGASRVIREGCLRAGTRGRCADSGYRIISTRYGERGICQLEVSFGQLEVSFGKLEVSFGKLEVSFDKIPGGTCKLITATC
jgi:hypothetical protein